MLGALPDTRPSILALFLFAVGVAAQIDLTPMQEIARQLHGEEAARTIGSLEALINSNSTASEQEKLELINEFYNRRLRFADDRLFWGETDYWATPLQTIARSGGDCEDFSIAKYRSLLLFGVPSEKLRMTYVKAQIGGPYSTISQAHMVVSYYASPTAVPLILDNLIPDVRPATQRTDLKPVFSFNSDGIWLGLAVRPSANNPTARMSRWRDVLTRMNNEGW